MHPDQQPRLVIASDDEVMTKYEKIAMVHKQIVEAKWRAKTAGGQIQINPMLIVHCEESITFLAGELLKLRALVEDAAGKAKQDADSSI